ncbi:MAG: DUF262 domain-containing protein [Fermentimonas sp.]|nr:DUF262 domain-containing protein [Fermentimonas sp.]
MRRRALPELLDNKYYIPEYQRGYRWEEKQVKDLLNDLAEYFSGNTRGQFYCLQPIVLKGIKIDDEEWYEIIDGQQRLCTLLIIMKIFDQLNRNPLTPIKNHSYTIRYATRPEMQGIFDSISVISDNEGKLIIDENNNGWSQFIDSKYIYNVARVVLDWFAAVPSRLSLFGQYFYNDINSDKSIQVVWYETFEDKAPHDIFNRMNSLKVELSCSELIRSLFLSSEAEFDVGEFEDLHETMRAEIIRQRRIHLQSSINEKWDELEQQMKDTEFQSFLTRRKDTGINSIGLLFDLMSGKYASQKAKPTESKLHKEDSLYTYLYFKNLIELDLNAWKTWERILIAFDKLQYWYRNRNLYHLIGFLNAIARDGSEDDVICFLLDVNDGKKDVEKKVEDLVIESMKLPKEDNKTIDNLSYENNKDYEYLKRLLILYNVETTRLQERGNFFSFNQFRYYTVGDEYVERTWTLEHIHAINSDSLPENKKESWYEWIGYNLKALKKISLGNTKLISEKDSVISELENAYSIPVGQKEPLCKSKNFMFDNIKAIFNDVVGFYNKLDFKADKTKPMHQLSNLTLLDFGQNSMVGKSPFEVKRQKICKELGGNKYVPICTRKVFLKLYDNDIMQVHSWSQKDRELYYNDIKDKLKDYISKDAFE